MTQDQETIEVLAAILALRIRHKANLADDGKESYWELLGYAHEMPAIKLAINGIDKVPEELANLGTDELPELAQSISAILGTWEVSHRKQDITNEVMWAIVDAIPSFQQAYVHWKNIVNMPLSALPA